MKYEFLATSSSGLDVYVVTVSDDTGRLVITCNCEAGNRGVLCRHRIALITNRIRGVYTSPRRNNPKELQSAMALISQYGIDTQYNHLKGKLDNLEKKWLQIQADIKTALNNLISP
ncbi:SWIM zinc finger family protein [Klebsiella michiganensis]